MKKKILKEIARRKKQLMKNSYDDFENIIKRSSKLSQLESLRKFISKL